MGLYIVLIGVQGAGKGTQAAILAQKYGIPHISTGDIFRAMKTQSTPLAQEVQAMMEKGLLIPDDVTNRVVAERFSAADVQNGVLMDGYPRTADQAAVFDQLLAQRQQKIALVPVLELDRETAIRRAEGRRYSQDKSRVYNIYFNPPKVEGIDDVDGQPLIQRADDYREAVEKRIDLYFQNTAPLIDYYRQRGLVLDVDASQSIEAVTQHLVAAIEAAK